MPPLDGNSTAAHPVARDTAQVVTLPIIYSRRQQDVALLMIPLGMGMVDIEPSA